MAAILMAFDGNTIHGLINTDLSCSRAMNLDMALGCSIGPDVTMASGGSTDHSDHYDPSISMVLLINTVSGINPDHRHLYDLRW